MTVRSPAYRRWLCPTERSHRILMEDAAVHYEALFNAAPSPFLILVPENFTIVAVNEAYLAATMTKREEIIGRALFDVFPDNPDDPLATGVSNLRASLNRVLAHRRPDRMAFQRYDIRAPASVGGAFQVRWWSPLNTPVLGAHGQITHIIHWVEDVTELVKLREEGSVRDRLLVEEHTAHLEATMARAAAEKAQIEAEVAHSETLASEAQLRTLADAIPTLVWTARADGHIDWYNQQWYRYTGTTPRQMEGWGWQSVNDPKVLPHVLSEWTRSIQTGEPFEMVFPLRGADGKFRQFLTRIAPLKDENGVVTRWFGTNTDVELEHSARAEAEAANKAKSDFLAVMSHELRTPLNAIGGYTELLELGIYGAVTEEQRETLGRVQKSQRHLLGLINTVLNYARVEAGAIGYEISDISIDEVLATCEALIAPQARAKRIELSYEIHSRHIVRADRDKVQQIVLNLLSNAIKFTQPGGRVWISTESYDESLRVRVSDTGIGVAAENYERIFSPSCRSMRV